MKKRAALVIGLALLVLMAIVFLTRWHGLSLTKSPLKIGLLHSTTGPMASSEKTLIDAELLAVEEINEAGGINGRKLIPIIMDGKSDEIAFAEAAERLITQEQVAAIVGCWRSADRKSVKSVVEKYDNLLLYPVSYEGLEESKNIIYLGTTPNQSIIPAITWCMKNLGKKFYLIGSDYVFPHVINKIATLHIASLGGEVVGEDYVKFASPVSPETIQKIIAAKPDVILNTVMGDSSISFFKELLAAGITAEKIPTLSTSISEADFKRFELDAVINTYSVFTYYEASAYDINRKFVEKYKAHYGATAGIGDNMQSAYDLVHMWAAAYQKLSNPTTAQVIDGIKKLIFKSPAGIIYFDENHNAWQNVIIGRFAYNSEFIPIWESERNIRPEPYPKYLDKKEWEDFLSSLYEQWGKRWSAL